MDQNVAHEVFMGVFPRWQQLRLKPADYYSQHNVSRVRWDCSGYTLEFVVNIATLRDACLTACLRLLSGDAELSTCDGDLMDATTVSEMWQTVEKFIAQIK